MLVTTQKGEVVELPQFFQPLADQEKTFEVRK
jgi:hypothetical protein